MTSLSFADTLDRAYELVVNEGGVDEKTIQEIENHPDFSYEELGAFLLRTKWTDDLIDTFWGEILWKLLEHLSSKESMTLEESLQLGRSLAQVDWEGDSTDEWWFARATRSRFEKLPSEQQMTAIKSVAAKLGEKEDGWQIGQLFTLLPLGQDEPAKLLVNLLCENNLNLAGEEYLALHAAVEALAISKQTPTPT